MKSKETIKEILSGIRNALISKKQIINVDELACLTGLSKSTIYKLTNERVLPHYKPGGKIIFFKRIEIDKWLLSNSIKQIENI